ncbi:MAG TPA: hypothetical protein DCP91_09790 [Eggerthellaceae bacterium]|nr:hypothetical protein [Eggerthellaceae bacterium]
MSNEIKVQSIGALLEEAIEDITTKASGIDVREGEPLSTGLLNLDAVLGGLRPGEVVCIAGTSRSGRHSLACQIGLSAAKQGAAVLIISAEMSARQVALRALAADARVDLAELDAGRLDEGGWNRVVDAAGAISGLGLRVCGNRDISMDDVNAFAEDAMGGRGKGLVVLCGVEQIAETSGCDPRWVIERMKALAAELRAPMVVTVDVAEAVVKCIRKGGYDPSGIGMAVGGVEGERDALMLLDRGAASEEGSRADAPDFGTAVVAVAKNRYGECGTVELAFVREYGRFLDLVDDADA